MEAEEAIVKPKITKKEIDARKEQSQLKYKAIKVKQDEQKTLRKATIAGVHKRHLQQWADAREGLGWAKTNKPKFNEGKFGEFELTMGYIVKSSAGEIDIIYAAYAIKAPHDKKNEEFGRGLVSYRLANMTPYFFFNFTLPTYIGSMEPDGVFDAISTHIKLRILMHHPEVPQRMIQSLFSGSRKAYGERKRREARIRARATKAETASK